MFDRILSSYMKEGYQWWPLFTSVTRKSMLCATKLQQTEDVVKKSFLLLPAGARSLGTTHSSLIVYILFLESQLDETERQRVFENVLTILRVIFTNFFFFFFFVLQLSAIL